MARLRQLAEASGEPVEELARGVLEDTVADVDEAMGDDQEIDRRIADWKENRLGVTAAEMHAWLRALAVDPDAPPPMPKRMP